ncbi:T9SS type A sorting domain-containing protein [bacterium]|nr:T9SS type A sorting domain-containing protein [bacterium]
MKKLMCAVVMLLLVAGLGYSQVMINEIQYDAAQSGTEDWFEWVELYNAGGDDVDLTGWRLCDNMDSVGEVLPSTVIAAGEYLVLAANVDSFHVNFPGVPAVAWSDANIGNALGNSSDILALLNAGGALADRVNWGTGTWTQPSYVRFGYWNPGCVDAAAGHSIGRNPNGFDTDAVTDWADMASPTPGASNGGAVVYTPHTIYEIQNGGNLTDSAVSVVAIVTSENISWSNGFFAAEAPGAWHGVVCYGSSAPVVPGDSVLINGMVDEYLGVTELIPAQVTVLGTTAVPAASDVLLSDVKDGGANAESYEGVLVRLPTAFACDTAFMSPTYGEWAVCLGADTVRIDNSSNTYGIYYAKPAFGTDSVRVTGVVTYDNGHFKVMPRDSDDVVINPAGVAGAPATAVPGFSLRAAYPNPAAQNALIQYSLSRTGPVELGVFNMLGQKVATLASGVQAAGSHQVRWSLRGDDGTMVPNGVYFYRLSAGNRSDTRKLVVVR